MTRSVVAPFRSTNADWPSTGQVCLGTLTIGTRLTVVTGVLVGLTPLEPDAFEGTRVGVETGIRVGAGTGTGVAVGTGGSSGIGIALAVGGGTRVSAGAIVGVGTGIGVVVGIVGVALGSVVWGRVDGGDADGESPGSTTMAGVGSRGTVLGVIGPVHATRTTRSIRAKQT